MSNTTTAPAHGVTIRTNARAARRAAALLSPTREFLPTGRRGEFFMAAADEVQALRDADFLAANGVTVLSVG